MAGVMKKIMIGFGALIGLGIALLVLLFIIGVMVGDEKSSSVPSEETVVLLAKNTMTDFARAVKAGDFRSFRDKAAQAMKDKYPLDKFNATFSPFQKLRVDWSEVERYQPVLEGKSTIDKNGFLVVNGHYPTAPQKTYFNLKYLKEKDEWKLAWIYVHTVPLADKKAAQKNMPSKEKQVRLLEETLALLNECVSQNDFSRLYESASKSMKALHSKEKIQERFSILSEMKIDFSVPEPFQPLFEMDPYLDDEGLLHLKGSYKNRAGKRYFDLTYVFQDSDWKMAAINVNWDHLPPSEEAQTRLVKETMHAFALAILSKDFTEFYNTRLAKPFQQQYSKEAFQNKFQVFIDKNIDLRVLDGYTPRFDEKPGLDDKGFLVLKGYYPTRPSIAIFDMKFMKIGDMWKLIRLFVNIKPAEDSRS